ncbi:MAG: SDR family oxidoreductase [Mobilicoccus sp.]|nr:SDR family oxidoreductase [Mobilicoccus sp.]
MFPSVHVLHTHPRNVLITGVTGFVGQAVLERFLREDARVHVVIRPRAGQSGRDRLDHVLAQSAFDTWRREVGVAGVAKARSRLHVIEGDLARPLPEIPGDIDLVVHSASTVSFDEPIDRALGSNVLGAKHLYDALERSGSTPHVVHVSTSYVNTDRTDVGLERAVEHDADWRAEAARALAARDAVEGAEDATKQLREYGRIRARALGWTDVYTMSKALGERVAEELWAGAGQRLTVLRPTIIESALQRPAPGWIDGFKVADPLIAAYAKDRLVAFPGRADAVLDVVPVDVVVDAVMATAYLPPSAGRARYLQVGTGVSNPITLDEFGQHVEAAVRSAPWKDRAGETISPRPWSFLPPEDIDAWVDRRLSALAVIARTLEAVPMAASLRARVAATEKRLRTMREYLAIYLPYTTSRTVYDDRNTRTLLEHAQRLGLEGVLDVTRIDWEAYLRRVHMPSLAALAETHRMSRRPHVPTRRRPASRGSLATPLSASGA